MFEAHVVNELLRPDLASGWVYRLVDYINGLVAPSFLFLAGMIFPLAQSQTNATTTLTTSQLTGWIKQAGIVLGLGYLLRSPGLWLGAWVEAGPGDWAAFWQVDVLHCIAIGWLLLLGIAGTVRQRTLRLYVLLIACGCIVALTPTAWNAVAGGALPRPLANYVGPAFGSLFPLFPWAAFIVGGAALGEVLQQVATLGCDRKMMRWIAGGGTVLGLLLGSATFQGLRLVEDVSWEGDPLAVVTYLALVVAVVAVFYLIVEPSRDTSSTRASEEAAGMPGFNVLARIGRQSLFLYALHLVVLYRWDWGGQTLATAFDGALGWAGVAVTATGLSIAMGAAGALWIHAKRRGTWAKWGLVGMVFALTLLL